MIQIMLNLIKIKCFAKIYLKIHILTIFHFMNIILQLLYLLMTT